MHMHTSYLYPPYIPVTPAKQKQKEKKKYAHLKHNLMFEASLKFCVGSIDSCLWSCVARELQVDMSGDLKFPGDGGKRSVAHTSVQEEESQHLHLGRHDATIPDPEKPSTTQTSLGRAQTSPEDVQNRLHQSQQGHSTATDVSQVEHEADAATNLRSQGPADHD